MARTTTKSPTTNAEATLKELAHDVEILKRQIKSLRETQQRQDEWLNTVNSMWIKRVWWFLRGYRYHRLGRWYDKDRPWGT